MRIKNVPRLLIFLLLVFSNNLHANSNWSPALEGNKIILIRHALAPGSGDPDGFNIKDCTTQRNLDEKGIFQAKKIGKLFIDNQIPIDKVLSSQWCRCKDTALYAFKDFKEFSALNSTFSAINVGKMVACFQDEHPPLQKFTHYALLPSRCRKAAPVHRAAQRSSPRLACVCEHWGGIEVGI